MPYYNLSVPISEEEIRSLYVGDTVSLSGVVVTARDAAHKFVVEQLLSDGVPEEERALYGTLESRLNEGAIYHCGPVVRRHGHDWEFVAAGPTTSIREEPFMPEIIGHFGLRGIIGKGGMGPATLDALQEHGAAYLHAIGGAASLIADRVTEVLSVHKREAFGTPEAFWVIRVANFPAVVTMDSHGQSIHADVERRSAENLARLQTDVAQYT